MTYVDDAFAKCKSTLEITTTEQTFASSKHADIRDVVRASWQLDDDFLTGSYRRNTKTKKLKDVDIFVVIDPSGPQPTSATNTRLSSWPNSARFWKPSTATSSPDPGLGLPNGEAAESLDRGLRQRCGH